MLEGLFKPRIESPDEDVRLEAYLELGKDDSRVHTALLEDESEKVRLGLLGVVTEPATLVRYRQQHSAAAERAALAARLPELFETLQESDAAGELLAGVSDSTTLAAIVRSAGAAGHRHQALEQMLAAGAAPAALCIELASRDEDGKVRQRALAAVDKLEDLERVASEAKGHAKDSYRQAKTRVQALREERRKSEAAGVLAAEAEPWASAVVAVTSDDIHHAQALYQDWSRRVAALELAADSAPEQRLRTLRDSFAAKIETARELLARSKALLDEIGDVTAAGDFDGAPARVEQWRDRAQSLVAAGAAQAADFEPPIARYLRAVERQATSADNHAVAEQQLERFEAWPLDSATAAVVKRVSERWGKLPLDAEQRAALLPRFEAALKRLTDRVERVATKQAEAHAICDALTSELEKHLSDGQLAEATAAHDKLQSRLGNLPDHFQAKIQARLKKLAPQIEELKKWRAWGTEQARQNLCAEAEALAAEPARKMVKRSRDVQTLREKWKALDRSVGAEQGDALARFNGACEKAYAPALAHFEQQKKERSEHGQARITLCAELERFASEHDWSAPDWQACEVRLRTARRDWREAGSVSRKQFEKLNERFKKAVAAIDEHLDGERQRELRRRRTLIEQLRKSAEDDPLETAIDAAKKAQRVWRPTIQMRRGEEQKLWDEFRAVCDAIFAKRSSEYEARDENEKANLGLKQEVCVALDALREELGDAPDAAAVKAVKGKLAGLHEQWQAIGFVPRKNKPALEKRYRAAREALETQLRSGRERAAKARRRDALERCLLVADYRQALAEGADTADLESRWVALGEGEGDLGRQCDQRWAALTSGGAGSVDAEKAVAKLALRAEVLANIDSPPEVQGDRMALKIERLNAAMGGGGTADSLDSLLAEWATSGAVPDPAWKTLRERFTRALAAINS